jgi:hypothetical protein
LGKKCSPSFCPPFLHTPLNYSDKSQPGSDAVLSVPLAWSSISAPQDEASLECQFPTNCESAQNKVRPAPIEHDYPTVEPPDYLRQLNPDLYQQECRRVQSRLDEAVQLAEQAFLEELGRLVDHLTDRLSGTDDGKPRVFRDSAVTNLTEFFERFRTLNVRSNEQLDELETRAQSASVAA